ncbi:MAG: PAS domain S-box protein [Eubacteriales bacterium]
MAEDRYNQLLNSMDEGYCVIDVIFDDAGKPVDWRYLETNQQYRSQGGIPAAPGQLISEICGGAQSFWFELYGDVAVSGIPAHIENEFKETGKWFDIYAFKIGGNESRKVGVLCRDISERRKTEEALQESEQRFRSVLDNSVDVIYRVNIQTGHFEYVSPSVENIMGYTPEQIMAMSSAEALAMIHPDDLPAMRTAIARLPETGNEEAIYRQRNKNGEYRWLSNHMSLTRDSAGQPLYRNGSIRDITEAKQTEEALRESEQRFRAVLNTSVDIIYRVNIQTDRFDYVSPSAEKIMGYTPEQYMAISSAEVMTMIHPDDLPAIRTAMTRLLETGNEEVILRQRAKSGEYRWLSNHMSLTRDNTGQPLYRTGNIRDITETRRTEEALRESEQRFRTVQENSLDRFTILKPFYDSHGEIVDFTYIYQNTQAAKTTRRSPEEMIGHRMTDFFPTFPQTNFFALYKKAAETGQPLEFEDEYRFDGVNEWFRATITPVTDGIAIATQIITERKRAEEALQQANRNFTSLFNNKTVGLIYCRTIFDENNQPSDFFVLDINPTYEIMTGIPRNQIVGMKITEAAPKVSRDFINLHNTVAVTGEETRFEIHGPVTDRWYDVNIFSPQKGYFISLFFNITERKQMMDDIKKNELLLNTIVQNTAEHLFLNDSHGRVVFVNDAYVKSFGTKQMDVIGKNALELYHDEEVARIIEENDKKVMQTGEVIVTEETAPTSDGIMSTFLVTKSPWKDSSGNIVGVVGVSHNITERKKLEEELKKAKAAADYQALQLNAMFENMTEGVIVCDAKGEVLSMNAAGLRMHGLRSFDEYTHYHDYAVDFEGFSLDGRLLLPEEWPIGRALKGETFTNYEMLVCRKDFDLSWIGSYGGAPVYDKNGDMFLAIITFRDITKQKEMDLELKRTMDGLKKADKNKNQFISVLSHELRNPLAVISASLSLFEAAKSNEQIVKTKEIIKRQTGQLTKLVDDLLELTRMNQNKITLKKEWINLIDIVKSAALDHQSKYTEKDLLLRTELPPEPVYLSADPVRITQCVGNLLQNALKFTPRAGEVKLSLETENNEAVIRVKDNGIGISPNLLAHIFEPFMQADTSLDRQNGGLGLGLPITKSIAELHGGTADVFSEGIGKGALFTIRLPMTVRNTEVQDPETMKNADRTYKILLIDDNESLCDVLCSVFEIMGHQAYAVHNGTEGIAKAKKIQPDIIFCDIGLPGLSGYEVAEILKADEELKSTFLVALTGYTGSEEAERTKAAGFDLHLAKPVDMALLAKVLAEI